MEQKNRTSVDKLNKQKKTEPPEHRTDGCDLQAEVVFTTAVITWTLLCVVTSGQHKEKQEQQRKLQSCSQHPETSETDSPSDEDVMVRTWTDSFGIDCIDILNGQSQTNLEMMGS
ncbi:hypothetical protein Q8A73_014556 [Channa argus]|nr:hypothetical protein Q8A73_014556 [Channa argus]